MGWVSSKFEVHGLEVQGRQLEEARLVCGFDDMRLDFGGSQKTRNGEIVFAST